jgi:tetratricopeptide (TPR) repeat protein
MKKLNPEEIAKLKTAIELQKSDRDEEALSILWDLHKRNSENGKVLGLLGLVLGKTEQHTKAILYLEKTRTLSPNWELIHLSLYNRYVDTEEYDKAFNVLFEYLKVYPADLFKSTLEELLDGLLEDYGTTYKDSIIFYSKKNNVPIPDKLIA